jgi:hypothetical protein
MESLIVSALVVSVFAIFAAALEYGQYQTRHIRRAPDTAAPPQPAEDRWLEAA